MHLKRLLLFLFTLLFLSSLYAQVLGACGDTGNKGNTKVDVKVTQKAPQQSDNLAVQPIPLPGQPAIDFELPAVVGNQIKTVKLSDYAGKWRVLCFFPADFTFV